MEAEQYMKFNSRRSPVLATRGCVASSQPMASKSGVDILEAGGNAADAAVAMAAVLNVTDPASTGIGGDCFALFYDASSNTVKGINGSGRSAIDVSLETYTHLGFSDNNRPPRHHGLHVTVPGAAAGWVDTIETFGSKKLTLQQILQPAIALAEGGFAVHPISANHWKEGVDSLKRESNPHGHTMLLGKRPPRTGDIMRMPLLAKTFKTLAACGKRGFYEGHVAEAIVDIIQSNGGRLSLADLKGHRSTFEDPINTSYHGVRVWELPPNGQGITTLMALNILEDFDLKEMGHGSPEYLHHIIEALKLSFADSLEFCADPNKERVPTEELLSKTYASSRRNLLDPKRASSLVTQGNPYPFSGDTVYLSVVDNGGNACSFINSNFLRFGTGLIPKDCGFALQCRGMNFRLLEGHLNCIAGGKRPYHTTIPSMITSAEDNNQLLATFGVMGGFMQPQGQVQVLLNMVEFGMNPQLALDSPRLCLRIDQQAKMGQDLVHLEESFPSSTFDALWSKGHKVKSMSGFEREMFGRGQVITKGDWWSAETHCGEGERSQVLWAGSDPRGDGMAVGM
ncbi:glutathione hydrolase-like YwrD proenzyme [Lytechinus pictus]|uniref:glutathione hydrolase-like YwrD proenzyme n=1 Tax=Lytechinus pictus TaxID=7653 RepID=UPI0030BA279B